MRHATPTLLLLGMALAGTFLATAEAGAAPRLSGTVTDYAGRPIYLADLDFFVPGTKTKVDVQPPGSPAQSEKTNFSGLYSLLVVAGTYDIRYQPPAGRTDLASLLLRNVPVTADTTVDVVLPRGYPLNGYVRDSGGNPVPDVDIDVIDLQTGERMPTPGDNTGSSGVYQVIIEPGVYSVHFTPPTGVRLAPASVPEITVTGPTQLDVTLEPGFLLSGLVLDPGDQPLAGIDLDVDVAGGGARLRTVNDLTGADGRFAVIVPAGTFDVIFSPPPDVPLSAAIVRGVSVSGDLELPATTLVPGVEVRARLAGPAGVSLEGSKALFFEEESGLRYPTPHSVADPLGRFGTIRVPAGSYHVIVALPEHIALDSLDVGTRLYEQDIDVVWDLSAGPLLTLSIEALAGAGPAWAAVEVWRSPRLGEALATAVTSSNGIARLVLPAGAYDLLVRPESGLEPDSVRIEGFDLEADSTVVVEFTIREALRPNPLAVSPFMPNPFRASTRLTIAEGAAAGLRFSVFNAAGRLVRSLEFAGGSDSVDLEWNGRDQAGRTVPAGVYFVRLDAPGRSAMARVVRLR